MSSSYTSNHNLCQWQPDDKVLRTEFNADNAKIDAALGSLASAVSGKASGSALNSLQTTVNGKADKSALDSLSATVTQHTSALTGKGNCSIYTTSYVGKGTYGESNPNTITFPEKPVMVFISSTGGHHTMLIQGESVGYAAAGGSGSDLNLTWSGNNVKWFNRTNASGQMNNSGTTYLVVALFQAS